MTFTDLAKSYVRTIVPAVVGAIIAWALHHGHDIHGYLPQITVVITGLYYGVARLLEHYVSPRFGWLLGVAVAPKYAAAGRPKARAHGYGAVVEVAKFTRLGPDVGAALAALIADPERGLDYRWPLTRSVPDLTVVLHERKVKGKPLGRHVHHDERSRAYPFTPRHTGPLVSVRHHRHVPPFDQGNLGSCTGNACAGALSTAPFTHRFTEARAIKIYEAATVLDNVPGSYPPDDTGSDGLSVAKVALANGWATRYEHCFDLQSVLAALQVGPVMLGVNWRSGFDNPAADGRMAYTGPVRGGHEICADEIDVANKRVWITNSWSAGWAVKGRAYWTWADLAKVLADQGDATVLVR